MYQTAEIKEYGARNFYIHIKFLPFDNDDMKSSKRQVSFYIVAYCFKTTVTLMLMILMAIYTRKRD